jgi:hypothetical protein
MILDFKANTIFILFSIVVAFGLATYLRFNDTGWTFIGLILALFGLLTYSQTKRNTMRFIQNYEVLLMIRLNAKEYLKAYQALVEKGNRFNPVWTITKHQRLAMGYLFTGDFESAALTVDKIKSEFKAFLEVDAYSTYLNQVLLFLMAWLQKEEVTSLIKAEQEAFNALPIKAQERLLENPSGYHQLVLLAAGLSRDKAPAKSLNKAFDERSNFMKVILYQAYPEYLSEVTLPEHQLFMR